MKFRAEAQKVEYAQYANVNALFGVIVARGLCTLHELETVYSYRDALDMGEIVLVQNYNEWAQCESARKHGDRN